MRPTRLAVLLMAASALSACGEGGGSSTPATGTPPPSGGGGSTPAPAPVSFSKIDTAGEASLFLADATFGGTPEQIEAAVGADAADILRAEFDRPRRAYLPRVQSLAASYGENGRRNRAATSIFWKDLITADDQLRQRMVFALSQILVISDRSMGNVPERMAHFQDVLGSHAFGNYRNLLEDVTYSPAMGDYLTYRNNRKGDERTGRTPDENYAREIMQLFTIGLVELNMDGTPKLGADSEPIETYTNDDIIGLARVFTGLRFKRGADGRVTADADYSPMEIREDFHSELEKTFLGTTIPAGTPAAASLDQALDTLFNHPNVPPFISRQLIQRFTASHPEPAYVRRVAEVFASGRFVADNGVVFGTGQRGDLEATLAAILLDESQFRDGNLRTTTDYGKVREPVLNFVHWARAFDVSPVTPENEWDLLYNMDNGADHIGQMPFQSESVFNFYRPGFSPVGTEAGDLGLTVPEFQIMLAGNRAGYINSMSEYVFDNTYGPDGEAESFTPDYTEEIALVETPDLLADHLNDLLLGGRMADSTRATIVGVLDNIPIRTTSAENTTYDRNARAAAAISIAVTAPEYMVR